MTLRRSFFISAGLFIAAMVIAFTPLAEGEEGTWQDMTGDIVWSVIFVTLPLTVLLGIGMWLRGRRSGISPSRMER